MNENFSESKALDKVKEAHERLQDGRRRFFKVLGVGGAAATAMAGATYSPQAMAYGGPYARPFILDPDFLFMNIGTTGSTPRRVLENLTENAALIARDPTQSFNTQDMRNIIAPGFGADPFEIVMSFNTTDGMSKIMNGLTFQAGDEIITTNMEHPGGNSPMQLVADRQGVILKRVKLPTGDAYSDAEVLARFAALKTPRTKAIVFSSPPYLTGVRLPEKELCVWAAQNGLISVIDGAHLPGMIAIDLHDMGCDFFAGAGHKWQCGPGQTGIMYVRNNTAPAAGQTYSKTVTTNGAQSTMTLTGYTNTTPLPKFFPTVSGGYTGVAGSALAGGERDPEDNIAATLMSIGNPSYPSLRALQEVCQMWDEFGRKDIENYDLSLAQYLRSRLAAIWGSQSLATPYAHDLPHHAQIALTSFNPFSPGADYNADLSVAEAAAQTTASGNVLTALRTMKIVIRNTSVPHTLRSNPTMNANAVAADGPVTSSHPLRISTHLFHYWKDVDQLVDGLYKTLPAK